MTAVVMDKFKPLLAYTIKSMDDIQFPVLCSSKIDGIRCVVIDGVAYSRSLKLIPNKHIQEKVAILPKDVIFDGELLVGGNFQETTSGVMSIEGTPDFKFLVFDCIKNIEDKFIDRVKLLDSFTLPSFCEVLKQTKVTSNNELKAFYDKQLEKGFEGVIVRSLDGSYKFGRSTKKEGIIGKLKPFVDEEFEVIGFTAYFENVNESELNELGYKKKSSKKEGKREKDLLGSFICKHENGEFSVGSGLTLEQREFFWYNKESLIGRRIKVKYLDYGIKELPRHPVFLGFRDEKDI